MSITYDNQFDNEPIEQIPNPNKKYYLTKYCTVIGFTHFFKLLWLIEKHPELLHKLSEYAEDANIMINNWTALHFVCYNYQSSKLPEVVKLLIKYGVNANANTNYNQTALQYVCRNYRSDKLCEVIKLLINGGADVNAKNNYNQTALYCISWNYHIDKLPSIEALIESGIDLDTKLLAKAKKYTVYDTIITYHKHDSQIIKQYIRYFTEEQIKLLDYFEQFKISIKPLTTIFDEFYYCPHNIGAILCESKFYLNRDIYYYSNKLQFLFSQKMF